MGNYVKDLVLHYNKNNNTSINGNSETTFMNKYLMPVFQIILLDNEIENAIYSM